MQLWYSVLIYVLMGHTRDIVFKWSLDQYWLHFSYSQLRQYPEFSI